MKKSLVLRLAAWFAVSIVLTTVAMLGVTHLHLKEELMHKSWQQDYPDHPDWKLHGSFSHDEVDDITGELLEGAIMVGMPLALAASFFPC